MVSGLPGFSSTSQHSVVVFCNQEDALLLEIQIPLLVEATIFDGLRGSIFNRLAENAPLALRDHFLPPS